MEREKYREEEVGMKVHIIYEKEREMKLEIEGEGHTFCNVLRKVLIEDDRVEMAGYTIPHPLTSNPIIYLHTKNGYNPKEVLKDAAERLRVRIKEFREAWEKALKEWQKT